jgi:hypothetical protein
LENELGNEPGNELGSEPGNELGNELGNRLASPAKCAGFMVTARLIIGYAMDGFGGVRCRNA